MTMTAPDAALDLLQHVRTSIPLTRAMGLEVDTYDGDSIVLSAPLDANVNDKGCAFGGSLASLLTLAGWALVELALRDRGEDCEVYVGESTVRYLQPVWDDLQGEARLADGASWDTFFSTLAARGKARIEVSCQVPGSTSKPAATLSARFVAKRRV